MNKKDAATQVSRQVFMHKSSMYYTNVQLPSSALQKMSRWKEKTTTHDWTLKVAQIFTLNSFHTTKLLSKRNFVEAEFVFRRLC